MLDDLSRLVVLQGTVPSLHVGFAVAVGIAAAAVLRRRWAGTAVGTGGVAVSRGDVFDIVAGLAVTALGFVAGSLVDRGQRPVIPATAHARAVTSNGSWPSPRRRYAS